MKRSSNPAAIALGILFPVLAIIVGLIVRGVSKDPEVQNFGIDCVIWSAISTLVLFVIPLVYLLIQYSAIRSY
jgi:hypothetical protein